MQPDYSKMAQQSQAQAPDIEGLKQDLSGLESLGLPEGKGKEGIKKRLLAMLESMGIMQSLKDKMSQQQIIQAVDELAEAMEKGDMQSIKNNPLIPVFEQLSNAAAMPQAQAKPAAPKDFAGMMPPGGGMSGR